MAVYTFKCFSLVLGTILYNRILALAYNGCIVVDEGNMLVPCSCPRVTPTL